MNETFVRRSLGGAAPLGRTLRAYDADWAVVGVSRDATYTGIREDVPPTVYFSFRQRPADEGFFALRTAVEPMTLADEIRTVVAGADASVPVVQLQTQLQVRDQDIARERLFAWLCLTLLGGGLSVGVPLALVAVRLIRHQLYGVQPIDRPQMTSQTVICRNMSMSTIRLSPGLKDTVSWNVS